MRLFLCIFLFPFDSLLREYMCSFAFLLLFTPSLYTFSLLTFLLIFLLRVHALFTTGSPTSLSSPVFLPRARYHRYPAGLVFPRVGVFFFPCLASLRTFSFGYLALFCAMYSMLICSLPVSSVPFEEPLLFRHFLLAS